MTSSKSQRIYLNTGTTLTDKYIQVKLEEEVDTIEFMSMNIYTKDAYQDFNSDYGVLVGRVIANGGIGIPNAKISIFIPLTDADSEVGDIASIYPYKNPRDKNAQGKRYNLLPRVSEYNPVTGIYSPKQPFGSFPIKPEIVTNQSFLDVYKKYYKYTALTNSAGDYMIFGVPIGVQTVHLSVDITDIGEYSMNAASMVTNLGYSPNLFYDNNSKIKPSEDLGDLPNIETQEISVNIVPFWGDTTNFIIGITRQDFRIRSVLNNTFVIFGSAFTDGAGNMWGMGAYTDKKINELYGMGEDPSNYPKIGIQSKRIGKITEKIYYYLPSVSETNIISGNVDPKDPQQMALLDPTQYSAYKRDGDFVFIINCNRNRVVTNEFGNKISVADDSPNGIFTKFIGFMTLEITPEEVSLDWTDTLGTNTTIVPIRTILKFPQSAPTGEGISIFNETNTENWRKQHYIFSGGSIYSVAKFNGTVYLDEPDNHVADIRGNPPLQSYSASDKINTPYGNSPGRDSGVIITNDIVGVVTGNEAQEMVSNTTTTIGANTWKLFGANWLNLCIYLPQFGYVINGSAYLQYWMSNTNFQCTGINQSSHFYEKNSQEIAAGKFNTQWFARSDLHQTDFVLVSKADIIEMSKPLIKKGFTGTDIGLIPFNNYRSGIFAANCPYQGGRYNGGQLPAQDLNTYFYKGFGTANCIEYLVSLGLV